MACSYLHTYSGPSCLVWLCRAGVSLSGFIMTRHCISCVAFVVCIAAGCFEFAGQCRASSCSCVSTHTAFVTQRSLQRPGTAKEGKKHKQTGNVYSKPKLRFTGTSSRPHTQRDCSFRTPRKKNKPHVQLQNNLPQINPARKPHAPGTHSAGSTCSS